MNKIEQLIERWRSAGPITWAEDPYGWTALDKEPITLSPWQKTVLTAWHDNQDVTTLGISNIKKTGKTLLNSVLLAWPWITLPGEHFCVGNDLDQSSSRQFQEITAMVRRNHSRRKLSEPRMILSRTLTYKRRFYKAKYQHVDDALVGVA
tara:strand:+ start:52 stop:501 length:450 start_codon:yes stop_codon:yes gene_type:complete